MATIHPIAEIVREVAGDRARVERLLPGGASPHTYSPRPSDARAVADSAAFFWVAPNLDGWAGRIDAPRKIETLELLPKEFRLEYSEQGHADEHDQEHANEEGRDEERRDDPHFWTDPLAVKAALPGLVAALADADPDGRAAYESGAKQFAARLDALHAQIQDILAPVKGRPVFQFHPSFNYMLRRYELRPAGLIEPFPGKQPTPRYLKDLQDRIRVAGAKAVFSEPQLPARPAEIIAQEAGVRLATLDPNGGREGVMSYSDLLLFNARALREALE